MDEDKEIAILEKEIEFYQEKADAIIDNITEYMANAKDNKKKSLEAELHYLKQSTKFLEDYPIIGYMLNEFMSYNKNNDKDIKMLLSDDKKLDTILQLVESISQKSDSSYLQVKTS